MRKQALILVGGHREVRNEESCRLLICVMLAPTTRSQLKYTRDIFASKESCTHRNVVLHTLILEWISARLIIRAQTLCPSIFCGG
jgi:hypothetical protein